MTERQSTTPFGPARMTPQTLRANKNVCADARTMKCGKWQVFRDVCEARDTLAVPAQALATLQALLSFHQAEELDGACGLVVWPSNDQLGLRAHGVSHATLRRHLRSLVDAGLIRRQDSPNGKRYARRTGEDVAQAFGFDLKPLLLRAGEIAEAAERVRFEKRRLKLARERITLLRRDLAKHLALAEEEAPAPHWDVVRRRSAEICAPLRRQLETPVLEAVAEALQRLLAEVVNHLESILISDETSGNDAQDERHYQNSNTDSPEPFEPRSPTGRGWRAAEPQPQASRSTAAQEKDWPLRLVVQACPDIKIWLRHEPRTWRDFLAAAETVRPLLGISPSAWDEAKRAMGEPTAAVAVAAILQRSKEIRSPGGYLRKLTDEADAGAFRLGPVLMALLARQAQERRTS